MRRLKLYAWSVLAILSVMFIACEIRSFSPGEFILSKLIAFAILIWAAFHIRKYTDVMEKDIEKLEELIMPEESEEDND